MNTTENTELKVYEVTHKLTGEKRFEAAIDAEDACKQAGWLIADCFAMAQKPRHHPVPDQETMLLVAIPCQTCSFQYAECRKPPDKDCPCRPNTPDLKQWLAEAATAHLCDFVGKVLTIKDYNLQRKWLPMDKAIAELSHKV